MYHYVRPLGRSRYPAIKGLDLPLFEEQLEYLARHYTFVSVDQLLDTLDGLNELPPRSALLSFDDGYADHYEYVLPRLVERGISGAFFPSASAVLERNVFDANKIHFTLASVSAVEDLVSQIEETCRRYTGEFRLNSIEEYRAQYWVPNSFDPAPVNYVKRMLQSALPQELRVDLTDRLFRRYVTADEHAFAEEMYMSTEQLRLMHSLGMHVGSHGNSHSWLGGMSLDQQQEEIEGSLRLLSALRVSPDKYTMCYPYGDFNSTTLKILEENGFKAGFTAEVGLAKPSPDHRFVLPRLDTNHLPKDRNAAANEWTLGAT